MLILPSRQRAVVIAHARRESPREACGVLAGERQRVRRVYRLHNVATEPASRYLADPVEQLQAFHDLEGCGWELLAIYHSHPCSPAWPSPTDLELAYYPEARYVIVSLAAEQPEVRCFRVVQGSIVEEELIVPARLAPTSACRRLSSSALVGRPAPEAGPPLVPVTIPVPEPPRR